MEDDVRPVSHSRVTITQLMTSSHASFAGKIHGGILLSLMDEVAHECATKHCGRPCVTVAADGVHFRAPVEVGELVSLMASMNYVGRSSMVVGVKVIAESFRTGRVKHTSTSFFTMVAMDEEGRPAVVPRLLLETREDARRFLEAMKRREIAARHRAELEASKAALALDESWHLLETERCRLAFTP